MSCLCVALQYLTTVIPYEKKGHPPSLEDLQILTKSKLYYQDFDCRGFDHSAHSSPSAL